MYLCIDSTLMYNKFFLCTGKKFSRNKTATTTEKRKIAILHVFPNMTLKILLSQYLEFEGGKQQKKSDSFEQISFTQWKTLEGYKCDDDNDDDDEGRKRASSMA